MGLILFIIVGALLICLFFGVPVGISMGAAALIGILVFMDSTQLSRFAAIGLSQGTNINQMVPPLFIMMAAFLARGGIASDIYDLLSKALKKVKGGLALATVLACTVFAALCGSSPATAAAVGRISVGQMVVRGYKQSFAIGTVAGGGTLGIMIPPSLTFVLYGILTETSIAKLLMAGLLPGIMISAIFIAQILIRSRLNPSLVGEGVEQVDEKAALEQLPPELRSDLETFSLEQKPSLMMIVITAVPAIALIFVVIGTMYTGIATPTEAAGFGVVGAIIIVAIKRRLTKRMLGEAIAEATRTTCMILLMIIMGLTLSYVVSYLGLATQLATTVVELGVNPWFVMIGLFVLWLILGMLMDPGSMVVLTIPFIYPALVEMGFDPIWVGVVSTLTVEIGMITPPVGLNLFVLKNVTGISMAPIIKGAFPYVVCLLIALVLLCLFPQIALYLPSRM